MKKVIMLFVVSGFIVHVQAADQALALLQKADDCILRCVDGDGPGADEATENHIPYYVSHGVRHTFGPLAVGIDRVREHMTQKNALTQLAPAVSPVYVNTAAVLAALFVASEIVPWRHLATSGGTTLYAMGVREIMKQSKHYRKRWGTTHPSINFPWLFIVKGMMG